jgi:putative ABC transport system ATP-binding protein
MRYFVPPALPSKVYGLGRLEVRVLRGVELEFYENELIVLPGPSGSGNSTLLNIFGGLDTPTSGQVFFNRTEITALDDAALTRYRHEHVGFVFQFYNLIPSLNARENVVLVTEIAPAPMAPEAALELVELGNRPDHFPGEAPARADIRAVDNA